MIKFQLFDSANSYQCHFAEISTFVVSISHYMRAYFNYMALSQGKDFSLPDDAAYLNVSNSRIECLCSSVYTSAAALVLCLILNSTGGLPTISSSGSAFNWKQKVMMRIPSCTPRLVAWKGKLSLQLSYNCTYTLMRNVLNNMKMMRLSKNIIRRVIKSKVIKFLQKFHFVHLSILV